ncbi:hydrolase [Hellea sp.]|nr:hydrolase [Hellea sp.]
MTQITLTSSESTLVDGVDDNFSDMLSTVMAWSSQNSGSHNRSGLIAMRGLLSERFAELPGEVEEVPLPEGEYVALSGEVEAITYEPALQVSVRPDAPVQLVLTGHYDTVFPKDFHFQKPVKVDVDTINGPGTADMKAGLMVMLTALETLERSDNAKSIGYKILMSPDEEIGSPGSSAILAELGKSSHVGLTYEPALADGSMAGARKGSGNFTLIIKGRAAHAGREHHIGRNAIAAMAEFIGGMEALNGQRDGVTFNIAKIDGGGAVNIVPELAIGRFNVRMKETADMAWIEQKLEDLVTKINFKDGISAHMHGGFTRPPKPMAPANAKVFDWVKQAGGLLGQEIKWSPSGGVCEGNNLWASGCPNVDTLGVRGGDIHSDREFMKISSLVECARLSSVILMKLASGEFDAVEAKKMAQQC